MVYKDFQSNHHNVKVFSYKVSIIVCLSVIPYIAKNRDGTVRYIQSKQENPVENWYSTHAAMRYCLYNKLNYRHNV